MIDMILIGLHFLLGASIIVLVLLQKSSSFGMGIYAEESLGKMQLVQKLTMIMIFLFALNSIILGNYISPNEADTTIFG